MGNQQGSILKVRHPDYNILVGEDGNIYNLNGLPRYTRVDKIGYVITQVRVNGKIKTLKVHRLVADTFLPKPSQELVDECSKEHWGKVLVMHKDNNKENNKPSNLRWGSLADNTRQAFSDGLIEHRVGTLNGRAKLNEEQVHELCRFFECGGSPSQAVDVFSYVSKSQASKIRCGIAWKHISNQYKIKPLR